MAELDHGWFVVFWELRGHVAWYGLSTFVGLYISSYSQELNNRKSFKLNYLSSG